MMERIQAWRDQVRLAFERLTQSEQLLWVGGIAAGTLFVLMLLGWGIGNAIAHERYRVHTKTEQLLHVLALQGEYMTRQEERQERLRTLSGSNVRLISLVEEAARQAGIEIGQLRPEDGEPAADGVIESRVDLRAAGLTADRLQDFINRIEGGTGVVIVRRLKVSRPYRKDLADIELTVTTYRLRT